VLEAADRLIAIGCFSVGTNQVDIDAARRSGIPVFNAPFSNTRSVAELVIGEIVILLRRIVARSNAAHQGQWDKSANDSYEVRGKTLGIIGYGNIGSQLSNLAEALGMKVIFYDPHRPPSPRQHRAGREPARTAGAKRRGVAACAGNPGHGGNDRARGDRGDQAWRLFHQQQPRHRRRSRCARRCAARRQAARRGGRRPFRSSRARMPIASCRRCRVWRM
jgi:hypothetical protein